SPSDYEARFREALQSSGIDAAAIVCRQYACLSASAEGGELLPVNPEAPSLTTLESLYILTLEDYNAYTGAEAVLEECELLNYSSGTVRSAGSTLRLFGKSFQVKECISADGLDCIFNASMGLFDREILVVRDSAQLEALQALDPTVSPSEHGKLSLFLGADFSHSPSAAQKSAFAQRIRAQFGENDISYKAESRAFFYTIYGGIFFIGIYLAILFLIVTVMIIYYKQISEGLEDRVQFQILSNTGLTEQEAKAVIRSQVRLVFFLPVGSAIVHILVSGRIVKQFLQALVPVDAAGFAMSIALVCSAFFGVYALVYKLSAKQYYEIVYGKAENQRASVQKTCSGN
ncbi:MAG: ABC transporter permease, partial [Oscillospiraceae bacterium]|nr:ABC transporter permease [Oscillospiraceae bacterium]